MAIIIGVALTLLSIGVVLYPFLRSRVSVSRPQSPDVPVDEETDLEAVYDAIQTLQLERQLGNVTEGLYREQLDGYRLQAAAILRRQMEGQAHDADWALEEEIRLARASLFPSVSAAVACPNCETRLDPALVRCPECGVELIADAPSESSSA